MSAVGDTEPMGQTAAVVAGPNCRILRLTRAMSVCFQRVRLTLFQKYAWFPNPFDPKMVV
jgi:hypothetical protein